MGDSLLSLALLAVLVYLGFSLLIYLMQARLLYFPSSQIEATPARVGLAFQEVALVSQDQVKLAAWFVPAPKGRGVILFCHGNGGNISHRLDSLQIFHDLGFHVLIFDYRGYGQSEGAPSEEGTYLDAEAAWQYLVGEKGFAPREIVLFGRSLGGAVAAQLAARHEPGGLILESVFTSVPDMAAQLYPLLPARLLSRYGYDARQALAGVHCPLLVVHSPGDDIIPFSHGRQLYQAGNPPKSFLEISGDHNSGFITSGKRYRQGLADFLAGL
ncbi:MAG TPA: alpha/beta hydrolase [Deltaproteobacteria bacterium]|nr:alpha/beta hydrolase [Deltaproteobacteria bacterium]